MDKVYSLDPRREGLRRNEVASQRARLTAQRAPNSPKNNNENGVLFGEETWRHPQPESSAPSSTPLDPFPLSLELLLFELLLVLLFVLLLGVHSGAGQASASGASAT